MAVLREAKVQEHPRSVPQHLVINGRRISGEVLVHQGKGARHTQGECKVLRVLKASSRAKQQVGNFSVRHSQQKKKW